MHGVEGWDKHNAQFVCILVMTEEVTRLGNDDPFSLLWDRGIVEPKADY